MTTTTTTATPTKLRNGNWGARVRGKVREGDTVTITTKSGKSWEARVSKVVWTDGSVAICATESTDRPAQRPGRGGRGYGRGTWTGCSCGSRTDAAGDLIPSPRNCWSCNHDA